MRFEINLDFMEKTQAYVSEYCETNGFDIKTVTKASVCCDELVSNVIRYSGATFGEINLSVEEGNILVIQIIDDGKKFNPLEDAEIPDINASLEERKIGGLGIFMVRKMALFMDYKRTDNKNVLVLKIGSGGE